MDCYRGRPVEEDLYICDHASNNIIFYNFNFFYDLSAKETTSFLDYEISVHVSFKNVMNMFQMPWAIFSCSVFQFVYFLVEDREIVPKSFCLPSLIIIKLLQFEPASSVQHQARLVSVSDSHSLARISL